MCAIQPTFLLLHVTCNRRAQQIHYIRGCPVGNHPLKYGCPVLNLVAQDFSQISKYKNIKNVSM